MTDPTEHLRQQLRDVTEDRNAILEERKLQSDLLTRAGEWLAKNGKHPDSCRGEGTCTCGLKDLLRDLR